MSDGTNSKEADEEWPISEDEWLKAIKEMEEYNKRPRLDNFLGRIDHEVKSHTDYYDLMSEIILSCRVFDDQEIQQLSNLVRTKWVGKPGNRINEQDEDFVFHKFIATPGMNDQEGPTRVEAIKVIMDELGKTDSAAAKLYDKVMRSYSQPHAKRGRKKGTKQI